MAKIEIIKQTILRLEGGAFQNLCNSYLYKIGYPNIVFLGSKPGTSKATIGTPDAYFTTEEGKYIFAEYTTQEQGLFRKIKDDIEKCLDTSKTCINHDRISEIIYCHTSSNITPSQDDEIRTLCKEAGVKLTIIGIDKLAEDLYLYHHNLVRDFLGISLGSDQIKSHDDFIKSYNSNRMAAPIDTEFMFRNKEVENIDKAYQKADIVILSGAAGTGKTRLGLHYAKNHSEIYNEKLYCIQSTFLPIYEDLRVFIDRPGNYFLFIDDANQLSGLHHIIRYANMRTEGYNVKILITVRDYAIQKVKDDIREISTYERVNIGLFTDDEIKELLSTQLGILNSEYQNRIVAIAEGNARIAILAGKVACDTNCLNSINDVSELYESYYGSILRNIQMPVDTNIYKTAGIVAFLEAIHTDHIDSILPVLEDSGLTRNSLIENIRKLHNLEILNIYNDKAVRFAEQGLSNYLLKNVFVDRKLISLSKMIKLCFPIYKERTISSINTLINIFRNKDLYNFLKSEIKIVWDELLVEESPYFFDFVKVFFRVSPTQSLMILQEKIRLEQSVPIDSVEIDTEKGKNYSNVTNDIIKILGGFAGMADLPTALDLYFQYFLKRPDLYMEFYHATILYFGIDKSSMYNDFYSQIIFFEKIKEYSDNWMQESIVILFIEVAKEFLKIHFTPAEAGKKNTVIIHQISLEISEGVKKYRQLIWQYLNELSEKDKFKDMVSQVFESNCGIIEDSSISVLEFDFKYIKTIMKSHFPASELKNCLLADRLIDIFRSNIDVSYEVYFSEYFEGESFNIYKLLIGIDYEERDSMSLKDPAIEQYIYNCDFDMFKQLVNVCKELNDIEKGSWEINEGLLIAFETVFNKKDYYVDAIEYYIENDTPNNLNPNYLVSRLFTYVTDSEVFNMISNNDYSQKNEWLYAYYCELTSELITDKHLQGLYDFLSDDSDKHIKSSIQRNLDFTEKYKVIDEDVLVKSCKIILAKNEYSPFMVSIYFRSLFSYNYNKPSGLITMFENNLELLEVIYFTMLSYDKHHDYDGRFLREIYIARPSVLDRYIYYLVDKDNGFSRDYQERNRCFFELNNYKEIYNKIFERLIKDLKFPKMNVPYFLEAILLPVERKIDLLERQDKWIRQCIRKFSTSSSKMYCLFSVVAKLEVDRKKEYISIFINHNEGFEDFKNIPLIPTSYSWSGSTIPMYSSWIEYLEILLPVFVGLKWINHKSYIERMIASLRKQIESEEIEEILEGRL